jgi:hypothetical protein
MAENDPLPSRFQRNYGAARNSWPQEDPPSLKLRRDKRLMAENDRL